MSFLYCRQNIANSRYIPNIHRCTCGSGIMCKTMTDMHECVCQYAYLPGVKCKLDTDSIPAAVISIKGSFTGYAR